MWLALVVYFLLLFLLALHYWRRFRRECPGQTFTFRITDIWAAMLGLAPSSLILSAVVQNTPNAKDLLEPGTLFLLCGLIAAQITGLFIGRLNIELPPHSGAKNAFQSAVSIVTGALAGLIAGTFCAILAGITASLLSYHFFWAICAPTLLVGLVVTSVHLLASSRKR